MHLVPNLSRSNNNPDQQLADFGVSAQLSDSVEKRSAVGVMGSRVISVSHVSQVHFCRHALLDGA